MKIEEKSLYKKEEKNEQNSYSPWTIEQQKQLVIKYQEGVPISKLSKIFGRSKIAIKAKIKSIGEFNKE